MYSNILVPVDGSDTAARGLREAMQLAAEQKSALVLLHVIDDFPMLLEMASVAAYQETMGHVRIRARQLLDDAQTAAARIGIPTQTRLREITRERVGQTILDEARDSACDLIVMGTHGWRGFNRLVMGSDAEFVARASPVPVLLVRSQKAD